MKKTKGCSLSNKLAMSSGKENKVCSGSPTKKIEKGENSSSGKSYKLRSRIVNFDDGIPLSTLFASYVPPSDTEERRNKVPPPLTPLETMENTFFIANTHLQQIQASLLLYFKQNPEADPALYKYRFDIQEVIFPIKLGIVAHINFRSKPTLSFPFGHLFFAELLSQGDHLPWTALHCYKFEPSSDQQFRNNNCIRCNDHFKGTDIFMYHPEDKDFYLAVGRSWKHLFSFN